MNSHFFSIFIIMFIFSLFYMLIGYILRKYHSKFPDIYAGYHVGYIAMKNHDTWETANKYSGKVLLITNIITLILDIIVLLIYIFFSNALDFKEWDTLFIIYLLSIAFIPVALMMILTEIKLRKIFDKLGYRKGVLDVFSGKDS